eukprot:2459546-Rhodomonas_salina.3
MDRSCPETHATQPSAYAAIAASPRPKHARGTTQPQPPARGCKSQPTTLALRPSPHPALGLFHAEPPTLSATPPPKPRKPDSSIVRDAAP